MLITFDSARSCAAIATSKNKSTATFTWADVLLDNNSYEDNGYCIFLIIVHTFSPKNIAG